MAEDTAARQLFEQLQQQGVALVRQWICDGTRESLILDFKRVPDDHKGIREIVSKIVSAFANSAGGTIVWGVATGKDSDTDRPVAISGVSDPQGFRAWLQSVVPNAVQPAALTETIVLPQDSTSGPVVVTFVPASDLPPHQATLVKGKPYYTRLDGHNHPMEHHTIADMFGRRQRPVLEVVVDAIRLPARGATGINANPGSTFVKVGIKNSGRGVARYPHIEIRATPRPDVSPWLAEGDAHPLPSNDGLYWTPGIAKVVYHHTHIALGSSGYTPSNQIAITATIVAEEFHRTQTLCLVYPDGRVQCQLLTI